MRVGVIKKGKIQARAANGSIERMQIFLSLVLSDVRVALFGMFILCVEYIHIHIQTRAKSKRAKENEAIMYVQRDDRAFECKRFDAVLGFVV